MRDEERGREESTKRDGWMGRDERDVEEERCERWRAVQREGEMRDVERGGER